MCPSTALCALALYCGPGKHVQFQVDTAALWACCTALLRVSAGSSWSFSDRDANVDHNPVPDHLIVEISVPTVLSQCIQCRYKCIHRFTLFLFAQVGFRSFVDCFFSEQKVRQMLILFCRIPCSLRPTIEMSGGCRRPRPPCCKIAC